MTVQFQPPPIASLPTIGEGKTESNNPVWIRWWLDLVKLLNITGGGGGLGFTHNALTGLQGGTTNEYFHLTSARHATITGNQSANIVFAGPATGAATAATFRSLVTDDLPNLLIAGGPTGAADTVPVITYNAKGQLTTVSTAAITPAAIGAPSGSGTSTGANTGDNVEVAAQAVGFTITKGTTPKTLTVALDANVAGTNTGDNIEVTAQAVGFTITKGTTPKTLTVALDANVSGTNTGDQTNISGNAATVTGLSVTAGQTLTVTTGGTLGSAAYTASTAYDAAGAAAAVTPTTLGLVIGTNTQAHGAKLDSIQSLASASGWLHNDGAGVFAYSTPTAAISSDVYAYIAAQG